MLLVNTRTSGSETSYSINEIDPRGGASITGDNGVGKTTTLELFPLFFGTLPSQISEVAGGREPMLKFVLPTPYSAIVFEYQVGDDEAHDVRCAVLRRTDNDHRPVYRLVKSCFREEAFTRAAEGGERTFCNDAQMVEAFVQMGVTPEKMLDIAEYRAVILGLQADTKDAVKLRRMSTEYGFGSRLTNLHLLIAAVAKERVDFKDFVRLAITIVQERLSARGDGPGRHRVTLRQSKEHIERWLRDRSALEVAFGLSKDIELLRAAIDQYSGAEIHLRSSRRRIAPALAARRRHLIEAEDAKASADKHLRSHETESSHEIGRLDQVVLAARRHLEDCRLKMASEEARRTTLHLDDVQSWAAAIDRIPQMQSELGSLNKLARDLTGKSQDIVSQFNNLTHQVQFTGAQTAARIRGTKDGVRDVHSNEADVLRQQHEARENEFEAEFTAAKAEISPKIDDLVMRKANLSARLEAAQASVQARAALEVAQNAAKTAAAKYQEATEIKGVAQQGRDKADFAYREAERLHNAALARLDVCKKEAEDARARATPPSGSLLSVLRQADPQSWKPGLARIIDPALLHRTDLNPQPSSESEKGVLGWELEIHQIPEPAWADDHQVQEALAMAEAAVASAQSNVSAARGALEAAAGELRAKKDALTWAETEQGLVLRRMEAADLAERTAKAACEAEVAELRANGTRELKDLETRIAALRSQLDEADTKCKRSRAALKLTLVEALKANDDRMNATLKAVEQQALDAEDETKASVERLAAERDQRLSAEGVDPVRLKAYSAQADRLSNDIDAIAKRQPIVNLWRAWLSEGGDTILSSLQEAVRLADDAAQRAESELNTVRAAAKKRQESLAGLLSAAQGRVDQVSGEIVKLDSLLREHGMSEISSSAVGVAAGQDGENDAAHLSVDSLRDELLRAAASLDEAEALVRRRHAPIRDQLTGRASSVAEYIHRSMDALPPDTSVIRRAEELCTLYRGLERQVLPSVVNDVTTIFEQVTQFRGVITRFEREVKRFNADLQGGMNVNMFQRLDNLKVEIVTNFGDLDVIREIDEIVKVARVHQTDVLVNDRSKLPDVTTANALSKFLYLLRQDSTVGVDLDAHVDLTGSVTINGETRHFRRPADLEHISSTGINAIILITLLVGMVNMVRGSADVYIPWISDEVGKFDPANFRALMETLRANKIDPVTASPKLSAAEYRHFARRYLFRDRGSIGLFAPPPGLHRPAAAGRNPVGNASPAESPQHEA